jgi:hypothetical protein
MCLYLSGWAFFLTSKEYRPLQQKNPYLFSKLEAGNNFSEKLHKTFIGLKA